MKPIATTFFVLMYLLLAVGGTVVLGRALFRILKAGEFRQRYGGVATAKDTPFIYWVVVSTLFACLLCSAGMLIFPVLVMTGLVR